MVCILLELSVTRKSPKTRMSCKAISIFKKTRLKQRHVVKTSSLWRWRKEELNLEMLDPIFLLIFWFMSLFWDVSNFLTYSKNTIPAESMQEAHFPWFSGSPVKEKLYVGVRNWTIFVLHDTVVTSVLTMTACWSNMKLIYVCKLSYSRIPVKTAGHFGRHLELVWHEWRNDDAYFSFSFHAL